MLVSFLRNNMVFQLSNPRKIIFSEISKNVEQAELFSSPINEAFHVYIATRTNCYKNMFPELTEANFGCSQTRRFRCSFVPVFFSILLNRLVRLHSKQKHLIDPRLLSSNCLVTSPRWHWVILWFWKKQYWHHLEHLLNKRMPVTSLEK